MDGQIFSSFIVNWRVFLRVISAFAQKSGWIIYDFNLFSVLNFQCHGGRKSFQTIRPFCFILCFLSYGMPKSFPFPMPNLYFDES